MQPIINLYAVSAGTSFLEDLGKFLKKENDICLAGCYRSFDSALKHFKNDKTPLQNNKIIIIDDLSEDKIQTLEFIHNFHSGFRLDGTKTIVYTDSVDAGYLNNLMATNARGIIHEKETSVKLHGKKLAEVFKLINHGAVYYDNLVSSIVLGRYAWAGRDTDFFSKGISRQESKGTPQLPLDGNNELLGIKKGEMKKHPVKGRRISALFISSAAALAAGIISLFTEEAFKSIETKKYMDMGNGQKTEVINYDVVIYDDSSLSIEQTPLINEPPIYKRNDLFSYVDDAAPKKIIYTDKQELGYIKRIINSGADGIVSKFSNAEKLKEAIIRVYGGEKYYCENIRALLYKVTDYDKILTAREWEIIFHMKEGLNNKEIAERLFLSVKTIERHKEEVKKKLGVNHVGDILKVLNT